jgi:quercetin dioxygenase-like cupin family protein
MDPYLAEFMPQSEKMAAKAHMHPGFEFLYVLEGELEVHHGEQARSLEMGDAAYFDSSVPHSYQCVGKRPAGAVIVTMYHETAAPPRTASAPESAQANDKSE